MGYAHHAGSASCSTRLPSPYHALPAPEPLLLLLSACLLAVALFGSSVRPSWLSSISACVFLSGCSRSTKIRQ
jgi:hypothetical protein